MIEKNQPIIAIATATGVGAVGIVRISGPKLSKFTEILFNKKLSPRVATLCEIKDASHSVIDQLVAIFFEAPNSYTGEDVLELQGHGGPVLLNMIQERCIELGRQIGPDGTALLDGIRIAQPGEFTERAFLNSKMDLTQAEAVMDLISASTRLAAKSAVRSLQGEFSKDINFFKARLIHLRVLVEASIDFPEEEIDFIKSDHANSLVQEIEQNLINILRKTEQGKVLRQGVNVVIAGQPNAGKSSLMNALSGDEIAIVTSIEGTTRDVLNETIAIEGVPFHLSDTAGLRENTEDEVEKIGIERAWKRIDEADVLLHVHDLTRKNDTTYLEKDEWIINAIKERGVSEKIIIHVYNKSDLINKETSKEAMKNEPEGIFISAKEGSGLKELTSKLLSLAGWRQESLENIYLARQRHISSLKQIDQNIKKIMSCFVSQSPALELIAEELRLAQNSLSEITGEFSSDDLLGEIFSSFCIGK